MKHARNPEEEHGWQVALRRREHPGRVRQALQNDADGWARISLPLIFLCGLVFQGFFALHEKRGAEIALNLAFVAGALAWAVNHIKRRTLRPLDPVLMMGCTILSLACIGCLLNLYSHLMPELMLKGLGTVLIIFALDRMDRRSMMLTLRDSEEYLESIVESIPDPLFIIGEGHRLIAGNRIAIQTFGEDILGKTCCEAYLRHDDCESCTVTEVWNRRKPRFEIVRDETGARRYEVTTFPLFGRGGFSGRLIQQIRDVSSEARTEDVASLLQDTVNSTPDPVLVVGLNGELRHRNRAAVSLIGVDPIEAPPRSAPELLPFENDTDLEQFVKALKNWSAWEQEVTLLLPDHERRAAVVSVAPIRAVDDRLLGSVVMVRDVTEVKVLQAQLAQQEKLSAIGELVSGVAHELNNPLTAVYGYAQVLLEDDLTAGSKEQVRHIYNHAERCKKIIENLLSFARQDSQTNEKQAGNLNDVVRCSLDLLSYQMKFSAVDVRTSLAPDLPDAMMDPFQLQQVLINLITNAQHAVTEARGEGWVEIRTRAGDGRVILEVEDNGSGMPEEVQRKIFDPFFTTKGIGDGTGLGLSLSYGIIRGHKGDITVESTVGEGTRFHIELPSSAANSTDCGAGAGEVAAPCGVTPQRILVVDDEPVILDLLRQLLALDGHCVIAEASPEVALARTDLGSFDLVFSDWRMPDMGGG